MPPNDRLLADRHGDVLRGKLAALDEVQPADVHLVISQLSARARAGQLLATYAANLLGRLEGVVATVRVTVEVSDPPLLPFVDPRSPAGTGSLREAVLRNASLSNPARLGAANAFRPQIAIGIGRTSVPCDVYTAAGDWGAYVGCRGLESPERAHLAIAPFAAAAFTTAAVFRKLRAKASDLTATVPFFFDAWHWSVVPVAEDPVCVANQEASLDAIDRDVTDIWGVRAESFILVGVGAVGCATLLALWASGVGVRASLIDGDIVAHTNLNRYVLFALDDRGLSKSRRAAQLLARPALNSSYATDGAPVSQALPFHLTPFPGWWSEYQRQDDIEPPALLISGVDTNTARHQLQDALPRVILGASTNNLRVEVGRYDLGDERSRCLKCFNPPEASESDLTLQRRLLAMNRDELAREADARGVAQKQLADYIADLRSGGNGCAILGGEALQRLRRTEGEGSFAVSFVSSLAGTLLAAQIIRESIGVPLLLPSTSRAIAQLWRPQLPSNAPFAAPRDPACWCHDVRAVYRDVWLN